MPASAFMPEIEVAIAFPDGYTTPAASRTWTVVDDYVEADEHVKIDYGRSDQHTQVKPSTLTLTLDNRDGRFTPEYAAGAYYPNIKKGRPIRVRARWPITTGTWYTLFTGYVDEWPVQWPDGTDAYSSVTITASSRMARLGRGATLKSIIEETVLVYDPYAYWTLGDASGSTQAGETSGNRRPPLAAAGSGTAVVFGNATGPGTDDLTAATFADGQYLSVGLEVTACAAIRMTVQVSAYPASSARVALVTDEVGSPLSLDLSSAGALTATVNGATFGTVTLAADSSVHDVVLLHVPIASAWRLYVDGVSVGQGGGGAMSSTRGTYTVSVGGPGAVGSSAFTGVASHVAFWTTTLGLAAIADMWGAVVGGFLGERSDQRVARIASWAGIPTAEVITETGLTTSMAHKDSTGQLPISLMQDVATTEDGLVLDARDGTLTFQARSHRYGSTSAFTLDCAAQEVEANLSPVLDDQGMVNEMTASRPNGIKVSPVNQASIDEYGYYRESLEVLTTSDNEVQSRADWAINRFGTPRVKLTNISVDLINSSSAQITALLAADLGTRFTVSNLPAQAPASSMQFFIEGITYDMGTKDDGGPFFDISFNTSAAAYADVWILDSASFSQLDSTTVLAY